MPFDKIDKNRSLFYNYLFIFKAPDENADEVWSLIGALRSELNEKTTLLMKYKVT